MPRSANNLVCIVEVGLSIVPVKILVKVWQFIKSTSNYSSPGRSLKKVRLLRRVVLCWKPKFRRTILRPSSGFT
jgi:hypothetical protein